MLIYSYWIWLLQQEIQQYLSVIRHCKILTSRAMDFNLFFPLIGFCQLPQVGLERAYGPVSPKDLWRMEDWEAGVGVGLYYRGNVALSLCSAFFLTLEIWTAIKKSIICLIFQPSWENEWATGSWGALAMLVAGLLNVREGMQLWQQASRVRGDTSCPGGASADGWIESRQDKEGGDQYRITCKSNPIYGQFTREP